MLRILSVFIAVSIFLTGQAQETKVRAYTTTTTRPILHVVCFVNEYKTDRNIMSLFKPSDVLMTTRNDPNVSQDTAIIDLKVKDSTHLVLKYLKHKAYLFVNDKEYEHGVVPGINPARVSELRYLESGGHQHDVLEVIYKGEEHSSTERIRYQSESKAIQYYDVDGKVITVEEFRELRLAPDAFESGAILSGKEAVQRYGDPKYADGVKVIRKKR